MESQHRICYYFKKWRVLKWNTQPAGWTKFKGQMKNLKEPYQKPSHIIIQGNVTQTDPGKLVCKGLMFIFQLVLTTSHECECVYSRSIDILTAWYNCDIFGPIINRLH